MADQPAGRGGDRSRGPEPGSAGWWLFTTGGFAMSLLLMGVLAFALMMLTRMLVEGSTEVDTHVPTLLVWFVICSLGLLGPMAVGAWRELTHAPAATELAVPTEPPASAEQVSERQPAEALPADMTRPGEDLPGDRLIVAGLVCLALWVPSIIVVALAVELLPFGIDRMWMLVTFIFPPLGWLLLLIGFGVRHRSVRTRWSRSGLAHFLVVTGFFVAVTAGVCGLTTVIMRSFGGVLISTSITLASIWLIRAQLPHIISTGKDDDGSSDVTSYGVGSFND
ncbi:MAG TPA: hypothetical protein H9805_11755 [Candidatus Janibacter merdipullorum]|nr:hypothetical protein [Candidatus Janibacter merdipullorum]